MLNNITGTVENLFDDSENRANIKLDVCMSMGFKNLSHDQFLGHVEHAQITTIGHGIKKGRRVFRNSNKFRAEEIMLVCGVVQ